jgi:hypothetical protein
VIGVGHYFVSVVLFWIFFLKDGTRHIHMYVYGLFSYRIEVVDFYS